MRSCIRNTVRYFFPFLRNERNRQLWVKHQLEKIPEGQSLLDAGAGECQYKKYCSHLAYTSQDFAQYDGLGDGHGLQTTAWDNSKLDIVSDITKIPVADASFQNILCTEVFEHIPYPERAVTELSRILKKDGLLLLTAPFASMTHFAPYHFSTGFNIYWFETIFKDNGLEIISVERNGNYFDFICQELWRVPLIIKDYTPLSYLGYILLIIIVPLIIVLSLISLLSKGSETFMCFGYHIVAKKR